MSSLSLVTPKLHDRLESEKNHSRLGIHSFHRYFGKLIPAIPAAAVEEYTRKGDTVMDPFCGSGTTLVETLVRGRNAVGIDVNPLSVLVAKAKTTLISTEVLSCLVDEVAEMAEEIYFNGAPAPPYCVNIHHWYRPKVIRQLASLHKAVDQVSNEPYRNFLKACLSAINRNVSNADPQHVFPGYSKRLRKLDMEKGRRIDAFDSFKSGTRKRIDYMRELQECMDEHASAKVILGHADTADIPDESVDLIVTNPPYISSVRYLETLKLEMSWAGLIENPASYRELDREQFGTERFSTSETSSFKITGIRRVDMISRNLFEAGHTKMSLTVSTYFRRFASAVDHWDKLLKPGGKVLVKVSPSRIRDELVPTPDILESLIKRKGYSLVEKFEDDYNQNSRSLMTARNYYSGRMDSDVILVMVKQ